MTLNIYHINSPYLLYFNKIYSLFQRFLHNKLNFRKVKKRAILYNMQKIGVQCVNNMTNIISAAKIESPQALALFPINDIDKEPYLMGKEQFKQMTHTHAFKPLKKVGEIKTIRKEETKTFCKCENILPDKEKNILLLCKFTTFVLKKEKGLTSPCFCDII